MSQRLLTSIWCALIGGPAVLMLELVRRAETLGDILAWSDDAVGAALLVGAAILAHRGRAHGAATLALAWAFVAGQLFMSLLGQFGHAVADPSGQPEWVVIFVKGALLAAAVTLAFSTMRRENDA